MNFRTLITALNDSFQDNFNKGITTKLKEGSGAIYYPIVKRESSLEELLTKESTETLPVIADGLFSSEVSKFLKEKFDMKFNINNERSVYTIKLSTNKYASILEEEIKLQNNNILDINIFDYLKNGDISCRFKIHNKKMTFGSHSSYDFKYFDKKARDYSSDKKEYQLPFKTSFITEEEDKLDKSFEDLYREKIRTTISYRIKFRDEALVKKNEFENKLKELNITQEQFDNLKELERRAK